VNDRICNEPYVDDGWASIETVLASALADHAPVWFQPCVS
jgi:hypothetical protein